MAFVLMADLVGPSPTLAPLSFLVPDLFAEGPFQSDALLVPEGCLFDHIHNASRCWPFVRWNQTGALACQDRGMQMRSFAMLLPCGISLFSGVEFVCCPKHFKGMLIGADWLYVHAAARWLVGCVWAGERKIRAQDLPEVGEGVQRRYMAAVYLHF